MYRICPGTHFFKRAFKMVFFSILSCFAAVQVCLAEIISDISQLQSFQVAAVEEPRSVAELQKIVQAADLPMSIAGARCSQGGQIAAADGLVIDLKHLHAITVDVDGRTVTAQAGATWYQVQEALDKLNFSVLGMQSYNDFTVGGSLSVNAHGRDIHCATVAPSVESIDIMLATGQLAHASRKENADLFAASLGGYGGLGVIVQATFRVTDNCPLERVSTTMKLSEYLAHFKQEVQGRPDAVMHSAYLYPPKLEDVTSMTFYRTDKPLTITDRFRPRQSWYPGLMLQQFLLQRLPFMKWIREKIDAHNLTKPCVVWRNYEMSSSIRELELARLLSTSILQEYFIPAQHLEDFVAHMRDILTQWGVNLLNVSLRYVPKDTNTVLAYAQAEESFALVLYINIANVAAGAHARAWTQSLINAAIAYGCTYYLPYQLHATTHQFRSSYPRWEEYLRVKQAFDPLGRFSNRLIEKYLTIDAQC